MPPLLFGKKASSAKTRVGAGPHLNFLPSGSLTNMEFALSGKLFLQEPKYLLPISRCEARHTLGSLTLTQRTIELCYLSIILLQLA